MILPRPWPLTQNTKMSFFYLHLCMKYDVSKFLAIVLLLQLSIDNGWTYQYDLDL